MNEIKVDVLLVAAEDAKKETQQQKDARGLQEVSRSAQKAAAKE